MSEARALTNFAGNAVATVLVATWTKELDRDKLSAALSGRDPFDEDTMLDPHDLEGPAEAAVPATDAVRSGRDAEAQQEGRALTPLH
jgi:aerobic C4-dicarboxylate transport protein